MSFSGSACAKVILIGEHAVVFGRPAIALPVPALRVRVEYEPGASPIFIDAPGVGVSSSLGALPESHPLRQTMEILGTRLGLQLPRGTLRITSDIPAASGLGSGAAVTTALARALASAHGMDLTPEHVSKIVYEVEGIYHGTPSGIDNSVIALERAIVFTRGTPPRPLTLGAPLELTIADCGARSETRVAVGIVREAWQRDSSAYERLFDDIGVCARQAEAALASGDVPQVGVWMNRNQELLERLGVSTPALQRLVTAAREAGARGAKLTGAGMGGNIIALGEAPKTAAIRAALESAGACWVFTTTIHP